MISSPDAQTNYIFETLQNQRDALMVENGTLTARVRELEGQLQAVTQSTTLRVLNSEAPDESPAN